MEKKLISFIHTKHENNLSIVIAILHNYNGSPKINNICRELVKQMPEDSQLLSDVRQVLSNTGVLTGEFGRVEAYRQKEQEIAGWLQDSDKKVKRFAEKYISMLEKGIVSETRRAEEDIELYKHQFGDEGDK